MDLSRPAVMTIVNCTPDSFYPESRHSGAEEAFRAALGAEEEGADIVDFGAESSRPGAAPVSVETELARLLPALRAFRARSSLPVSVDTRRAAVARAALDEGADIVNDISALSDPEMAKVCAERGAAVVLMHTRESHFGEGWGTAKPAADKTCSVSVPSVLEEVRDFLETAAEKAAAAGVSREKIILDPGIGFGKTLEENLTLIARLAQTAPPDYPLLIGLSRKRFAGELTGRDVEGRLAGTLAASYAALCAGADILRVHDTAAARDLIAVFCALEEQGRKDALVSKNR